MTKSEILNELARSDGAILCWQVADSDAFQAAHLRGDIRFDCDTDCFVHPDAIRVDDNGGYVMPSVVEALKTCVRDLLACADPQRDRVEIKRARDLLRKLESGV